MPEETTSAGTVKTTAEGNESTATATATQAGKTETAETPKTFTQDDIDRLIGRTKKELKAEYEKQISQAKLSEEERAKAENDTLRKQLRERDAKDAVVTAAQKAGATANPQAVYRLIKDDLEFDKDGKVTNLEEALAEAKSIAPELFKAVRGTANGGEGNEGRAGNSMNSIIRRAAGRE